MFNDVWFKRVFVLVKKSRHRRRRWRFRATGVPGGTASRETVLLQGKHTGKPFLFLRTRLQFSLLPQNERGGRQRCFSHTSSAGAAGTNSTPPSGGTVQASQTSQDVNPFVSQDRKAAKLIIG